MKLRRISVVVASGLMAVVTVIGLSGTAKASESYYTNLCVLDSGSYVCAYSQGAGNTVLMLPKSGTGNNTTNWYWPDTNTANIIKEAATTRCMQLNKSAGDIVIEAACVKPISPTYQVWTLATNGEFSSDYDGTCLTYNKSKAILDTAACNGQWYQHWYGIHT